MAESAEGEEPDWNALLTEDDNTPEKPSEEDATQKKKLNAVKKKKLDYVDIAGKLILFPFFLVRVFNIRLIVEHALRAAALTVR